MTNRLNGIVIKKAKYIITFFYFLKCLGGINVSFPKVTHVNYPVVSCKNYRKAIIDSCKRKSLDSRMYPADTECTRPASAVTHTSHLFQSFPNISSAKPALLNL